MTSKLKYIFNISLNQRPLESVNKEMELKNYCKLVIDKFGNLSKLTLKYKGERECKEKIGITVGRDV